MVTYKFKLYNDNDNKYLHDKINIAGIIYNHCIDLHKRYYKSTGKYLNKYQLQKHITKWKKRQYPFWGQVGSQAIQNITSRIDDGYSWFFKNIKSKNKRRVSPPSFKKVRKYKSITYTQAGYKFLGNTNIVKIQGRKYRYHKSREIQGNIKTLTIKRNPLGEFYITIVTDYVATGKTENENRIAIGVDFGLKTFLNFSTGEKIESPLFLKQSLKKLQIASRNYSTKKKGSNNKRKAKLQLLRRHEKICNQRQDWSWKTAIHLCENYNVICLEDLNIAAMQKLWGRKITDLGFASFVKIMECQAKKYNTKIVYIDRFFPSSKMCSHCGAINTKLELKDREWTCSCGRKLDRDLNASRNILKEGLRILNI